MTLTSMQEGDLVQLKVEISRSYGQTTVTLGAVVTCEIGHEAALQRAYDEITDTLIKEHRRQVERIRPVASSPSGPPSSGNKMTRADGGQSQEPSETTQIFPAEWLVIEERNGKRYYKIAGGKFEKFGVKAWLEDEQVEAELLNMDWERLPAAKHKIPGGLRAIASMAGRNPVKVLRLLPPDEEF